MFDAFGIHIGFLYIHYYALILMTGMIVGAWLVAHRAKAHGLDPEHVWNGLMWALIPGLIGARLYHVLTPSPASDLTLKHYLQNPLEIFAIWNGGLGIYGAIVGGAIGLMIYGRRHHQPYLPWFDLIVPSMAIAQAIGRWGNFANQELYGAPSTLPWAIYISPDKRLLHYELYATYHPLFLYESLWNLGAGLALIWIDRRFRNRLREGDILLLYLMEYPVIRFLLDFLRLDSNLFGPLTTAQVVSLIVFFGAGTILVLRHRRPRPIHTPDSAPSVSKEKPGGATSEKAA